MAPCVHHRAVHRLESEKTAFSDTQSLLFLPGERLGHDHGDPRPGPQKTNEEERGRGAAAGNQEVFGRRCQTINGRQLPQTEM